MAIKSKFFVNKKSHTLDQFNRLYFIPNIASDDLKILYLLAKSASIDHICYRTTSLDNYQSAKNLISTIAILLIESEVNGRNIATYRLNEAIIISSKNSIWIIEIPAPKKNSHYDEGFEHLEIVSQVEM